MAKDYIITIKDGGGLASQQRKRGLLPTVPGNPNVDRRRGGLGAQIFGGWGLNSDSEGIPAVLKIRYPKRNEVVGTENRDEYFKTGDVAFLHIQSYDVVPRPGDWQVVPNGEFTVAGMRHYFWWKRVEDGEVGIWDIPNSDPFSIWELFGLAGVVEDGNPFYQTTLAPASTTIQPEANQKGDFFFAHGFPNTFGSSPSSVPSLEFSVSPHDEVRAVTGVEIKSGNSDGNLATNEEQNQGYVYTYDQAKKKHPLITVTGTGQVFSGYVKWQKPTKVLDVNLPLFPLLKQDLIVGVWFNDGNNTSLGSEGIGFWPKYFTEFNFSIPPIDGVSVHVGYRRVSSRDFNQDPNAIPYNFNEREMPPNAVYLRNASTDVELIGTGGGSGLIELSGTSVTEDEMAVLFTVFPQPPYTLNGFFKSADLASLSLSRRVDDTNTPGSTFYGQTGSTIIASSAYGKNTSFSASYAQTRIGGLPVTPARTFAIKVRRK